MCKLMWVVVISLILIGIITNFSEAIRRKRTLTYTDYSSAGIILAAAVPIELADRNVYMSFLFEVISYLPTNIAQYGELDPFAGSVVTAKKKRSISRKLVYDYLTERFTKHGFAGRYCLLRHICESSEIPLNDNGVLGQIMHVIFTPSASRDESLDEDFYRAEYDGLNGKCEKYFIECPTGLFDFITTVAEIDL